MPYPHNIYQNQCQAHAKETIIFGIEKHPVVLRGSNAKQMS
jgi:hypothetical protein